MMKYSLWYCLLMCSACSLFGQSERPISIAYFSQFAIEPGVKISTEISLKQWTKARLKTKNKTLFVSPQVGFFVRPENNSNLFIGTDIGLKKQGEGKSAFSAFSLGLGYLHQFQISAVAVELGSGNQSITRAGKGYFLPTLNYAFGNQLREELDWYSKIGVGQRLGGEISSAATVLFEIGLQF